MTFKTRNMIQARLAKMLSVCLFIPPYRALRIVGVVYAAVERVVR